MSLDVGDNIPALELPATGDKTIDLQSLKGKPCVIYFYPKDNTPGCTQEGEDFRDMYTDFQKAGCEIFGVSRDSLRSHENFKEKYSFPFDLISDGDEEMCNAFDVIKEKNMYGRKVMGIERSTFLFDTEGKLHEVWRKVKVKGHAAQVLETLQSL